MSIILIVQVAPLSILQLPTSFNPMVVVAGFFLFCFCFVLFCFVLFCFLFVFFSEDMTVARNSFGGLDVQPSVSDAEGPGLHLGWVKPAT